MRRLIFVVFLVLGAGVGFLAFQQHVREPEFGAPPAEEEDTTNTDELDPSSFLRNWKRPDGPLRVGLQVGHWKTAELPNELHRLRERGGGTRSSSGVAEWEVVMEIAERTATLLEREGIVVDLLPATTPPSYWADAFISIHADGSEDRSASGFKVAAPRRDFTGRAQALVAAIEESYAAGTQLPLDPNITRNMRGYYAFSWWRYTHAVHPMAPSVILETGFLTNPREAQLLINRPDVPAQALAEGILQFLQPASTETPTAGG